MIIPYFSVKAFSINFTVKMNFRIVQMECLHRLPLKSGNTQRNIHTGLLFKSAGNMV